MPMICKYMLTLKGLKNYITINEKLKMSKKNPTGNLGMRNVYNSKKKGTQFTTL